MINERRDTGWVTLTGGVVKRKRKRRKKISRRTDCKGREEGWGDKKVLSDFSVLGLRTTNSPDTLPYDLVVHDER